MKLGTRSWALLAGWSLTATAQAVEIFPLDQVRPGMVGVGRTVFEGSRIEEFKVEIIGVLANTGPQRSIILARLEGGPLAQTGVIAGMSGSPVFIEGKLLGAVAYGFPFSKETIAGITPMGEMVDAGHASAPRSAATRFPAAFGTGGPAAPLDPRTLAAALNRPLGGVALDAASLGSGRLPPRLAGASLSPLSLPLVFSGFEPAAFEWARGLFSGLGFTPMLSGAGGEIPAGGKLPPLEPGSALGVSLIEGDMDLSVTGTVTDVDAEGRVYAFGHPFYNLGPTQFPMKKAYVYSVFPSLYQSWKISAASEPVGTIDQDRTAAVSGKLGSTPRMIPVTVDLATSRQQQRRFAFRIVDDDLFSPLLTYVALASVLQANERAFGSSSIRVKAKLSLGDGREVRVEDLYAQDPLGQEQPGIQASALVAAPLAYLISNDFQPVRIDKVEIEVAFFESIQAATLERAWLDRSGPIRPGSTVPLRLLLRGYRGQTESKTIPVSIPASAPAGAYHLILADSATSTALEQRDMRQPFVPKDLDQLVRALNGLRRNHHLYARLVRADEGAIVSGEYLMSLPPSVLGVLQGADGGRSVVPLRTASLWEYDLPTSFAVTGTRSLLLTVER